MLEETVALLLNRSIKGKVKRKISPYGQEFTCFRAPVGMSRMCFDRPHHLLGSWGMDPEVWVFSGSGCHRLLATKPVQFRNQ